MRATALGLIRAYQLLISPLLPPACRFYPSCSNYAAAAVREHGVVRGSWLAFSRLARCHPWHPGGVDFVPAAAPHGARHLESR
ncbi:MAG: membrane protein insertion efficiency factor YidD [Candidatus Cybelea sp.]|jgi:putative membrane protein insertion efficiency factor